MVVQIYELVLEQKLMKGIEPMLKEIQNRFRKGTTPYFCNEASNRRNSKK